MFAHASRVVHEAIYGLMGLSQPAPNQITATNGTGFMIAPAVIVTAAHICHINNNLNLAAHTRFEVICSPHIGQRMETAVLIAEDTERDIALLRIEQPRTATHVQLECNKVPSGTSCGSLGFPLAVVAFLPSGRQFNLIERFQGAHVSSYRSESRSSGRVLDFYETDSLMYGGSSGCPAFLPDGKVFALHIGSTMEATPAPAAETQANLGTRLAISYWVPASDIRDFAQANGVALQVSPN